MVPHQHVHPEREGRQIDKPPGHGTAELGVVLEDLQSAEGQQVDRKKQEKQAGRMRAARKR
jgi:hypothetical protein